MKKKESKRISSHANFDKTRESSHTHIHIYTHTHAQQYIGTLMTAQINNKGKRKREKQRDSQQTPIPN